jgi:hypothetical protein
VKGCDEWFGCVSLDSWLMSDDVKIMLTTPTTALLTTTPKTIKQRG